MASGSHEYYETLGVRRTASSDDIHRAHRRLARRYHPDVNPGDKSAAERFRKIQEAYEVLIDSNARRTYDQTAFHSETGSAGTPVGTTGGASPHPATDVDSSEHREGMHEGAAGHVGLRDFRAPRIESRLSEIPEGLVAVFLMSYCVAVGSVRSGLTERSLASFDWGVLSVYGPIAILSAMGFLFGGTRRNFLPRCALVNTVAWCCWMLYCGKAQGVRSSSRFSSATMQMLLYVLATHVPVMVGACFRRSIASLTRSFFARRR